MADERHPSKIDESTHLTADGERGAKPRATVLVYLRDAVAAFDLVRDEPLVVGRSWPADAVVDDASLSRQHARFTWTDAGVRIEDLGSTNGTRVHGQVVEDTVVGDGAQCVLGSVTASISLTGLEASAAHGLYGFDRFLPRLEEEVVRARTFHRSFGLALLRVPDEDVSSWLVAVRNRIRPADLVALYSSDSVLVLFPECDSAPTLENVRAVARELPRARAGVATFPESATGADELIEVARCALRATTEKEPIRSSAPAPRLAGGSVVVVNARMHEVHELARRLAPAAIPVLVLGETGTGKEILARAIHEHGPRADGPMRSVNCGAIPRTLMESVLFGHERGAFTGADAARPGLFEQADGGTVFLDEVGELSSDAQVALRERRDEILPLAEKFLGEACESNRRAAMTLSDDAAGLLCAYSWPGNVRELRNVIERAVVVARSGTIEAIDLSDRVRGGSTTGAGAGVRSELEGNDAEFKDRIREYETQLIIEALKKTRGNQTEAAKLLRIPLRTMLYKMRSYGISKQYDR